MKPNFVPSLTRILGGCPGSCNSKLLAASLRALLVARYGHPALGRGEGRLSTQLRTSIGAAQVSPMADSDDRRGRADASLGDKALLIARCHMEGGCPSHGRQNAPAGFFSEGHMSLESQFALRGGCPWGGHGRRAWGGKDATMPLCGPPAHRHALAATDPLPTHRRNWARDGGENDRGRRLKRDPSPPSANVIPTHRPAGRASTCLNAPLARPTQPPAPTRP